MHLNAINTAKQVADHIFQDDDSLLEVTRAAELFLRSNCHVFTNIRVTKKLSKEAVGAKLPFSSIRVIGKKDALRIEGIIYSDKFSPRHSIFMEIYRVIYSVATAKRDAASNKFVFSKHPQTSQGEKDAGQFAEHLDGFVSTSGFEFSSVEIPLSDVARIQSLIDSLRVAVIAETALAEDHRSRLLKRLEALQMELHKKRSNLDRFWGLLGDAGMAFGKLGKGAKPVIDVIRQISDIIWKWQTNLSLPDSDSNHHIDDKS